MTTHRFSALILLLLGCLVLVLGVMGSVGVAAQGPQPPRPPDFPIEPQQAADGTWYVLEAGAVPRSQARLAAVAEMGGPDDFGYTWGDEAGEWVDASGGMDTGLTGDDNDRTGPIDIGFPFKYYENTYTSLYISVYGFIAFQDIPRWVWQSPIPNPRSPNDVIAPFWTPVGRVDGYVRYLRMGSAPNRRFVVEWNQLIRECCGGDGAERYTFQVVLEESGDIWLQYQEMQVEGWYSCGVVGIEDATGLDGLPIASFCTNGSELSNRRIRIRRPPPMARVKVLRPLQGSFVRPGETITFTVPLRNTGELGPDTYEIESTSSWTTTISLQGSPLLDSDGNGQVDTGPVEPLGVVTLTARLQVPEDAAVGSGNELAITVRSRRDATQSRTATIRTAVPTSFVQVFRELGQGTMQAYMVQPNGQAVREIGDARDYGWDGVVAGLPSEDFLYLWRRGRYDSVRGISTTRLQYVLLDRYGNPRGPIRRLTDHSQAIFNTNDLRPAVDVAGNGWIGVTWPRYSWRRNEQGESLYNYNLYVAILDAQGDIKVGPLDLTRNPAWGTWQAEGVPYFETPRVAATEANRFFVAWHQRRWEAEGYVDEIWYAVLNGDGTYQVEPTRLTEDTPGWDEGFQAPVVEHLDGERVLVLYRRANGRLYFTVVNSATGASTPMTELAYSSKGGWSTPVDMVRMPDGRLALALHVYGTENLGEQGWQASYFNNMTLSGTPVVTRWESRIAHSWGMGSPDPQVNVDEFSARWEGTLSLPPGDYSFRMFTDDGGRLWIDDRLVLDRWNRCCETWNTVVRLRGTHTVRMEMFERDGAAGASLNWYRLGYSIQLLFFNESGAVVAGPVTLDAGGAVTTRGPNAPAMSLDSAGRLVLTWADAEWSYTPHLYYALVDGGGTVLTPPTVFYTVQDSDPPIVLLNTYGYHNAPYRWSPPSGVDTVAKIAPELAAGPPGGLAHLEVRYANYGGQLSTGTRITATLGSGLTYMGDTSGITPSQTRDSEIQVVWQVPDLPLLEQRTFWLTVGIPENAEYGTRYPVSVEIGSQEPESAPEDNRSAQQVMAARQIHLPRIERLY